MTTINYEDIQKAKTKSVSSDFGVLVWIKSLIESVFSNLSLAAAPALPATLFGMSVGKYLVLDTDPRLATLVGFVAGFSIEAAGFNAFKAKEKSDKPLLAVSYLVVGVLITVVLEYQDLRRMLIGLSGFAIVAIVYWSINTVNETEEANKRLLEMEALAAKKEAELQAAEQKRLEEAEAWEREQAEKAAEFQRQQEAEQEAWQREQAQVKAEFQRQLKLQRANKANTSEQRSDWRSLSVQDIAQLPFMETNEITEKYGCPSGTARRWRAKARKMNAKANGETNGK